MSRAAARHEAEPPQEAELLFFASLQMLGLPPTSAQKQAGAVLGPTMFRQPNPKALEFVLHSLFERIRGRDSLKKVGSPRGMGRCAVSARGQRVAQPCRPPRRRSSRASGRRGTSRPAWSS